LAVNGILADSPDTYSCPRTINLTRNLVVR